MPVWSRQWQVPSSDGSREYTVSADASGNWACSCPRWIYRRDTECKHIKAVKIMQSGEIRQTRGQRSAGRVRRAPFRRIVIPDAWPPADK